MKIHAILGMLLILGSAARAQNHPISGNESSALSAEQQTEKGADVTSFFDRAGKAHRIYQDWNGTPRTTDFLLQTATGSESAVSSASSVVFMPQTTGSVFAGTGQEIDAILFFPKIVRPSKGAAAPTLSGVAIAAPIDGGGGVPALDAATLRIESNPPSGMGTKSWALAVDAGDVKIGNHLYFPNPSGIQQARGDMIFDNLDASSAGTISFYSAGALRMRMQPSGVLALAKGLAVGDGGSVVQGIYRASKILKYSAIAGQHCEEQEMPVPNARSTGTAMASPAESPGSNNLIWSAWINGVDKVEVRLCNPTSTSVTPEAVNWNVTVIQ